MENKIQQLLMEHDQVSMTKDVLPLVLEEFELTVMDAAMYDMACQFVKQQLYAVQLSGIQVVCYPVFSGQPHSGTLSVVDIIWEKMSAPNINFTVTMGDQN